MLASYTLNGNDYRVAMLPKSYLTVIGLIMQSLKSIGHSDMFKLKKILTVPDGRNDSNYRKASLLTMYERSSSFSCHINQE